MKISDLELFLLIVQEGSLNKAAEKCFMTEAALSQQLKKIEAEAGCQLFYRQKGKRLELSEKGAFFQKTAQAIVGAYGEWTAFSRRENSIKIGVSIRRSQSAIEALQAKAADFSPSRYVFVETTHQERELMVESGELDLAFTSLPLESKRLAFSIVDRRPVGIYLRKGHLMEHTAYRKEGIPYPLISPKVLESESFLLPGKGMPKQHALAIRIFQKYHIEPNIRETFQAMSYGAIMAEEGLASAVSILLDEGEQRFTRFFLIEGCNITYDTAVAYKPERKRDRDIQHIIQCFREYFHFPPSCHC